MARSVPLGDSAIKEARGFRLWVGYFAGSWRIGAGPYDFSGDDLS